MTQKSAITRDTILSVLSFDRETGVFVRRHGSRAGQLAGNYSQKGALSAKIGRIEYPLAALVWVLEHGSYPQAPVRHINGNSHDNRPENL